jgi:hypothetical protein
LQIGWDFRTDWHRAAKVAEALHALVRGQHRKQQPMNLWVQGRVNGMLALCHLFSRPGSNYTWTEASELAAKSIGHGRTFARKVRRWAIEFERQGMDYTALPLTRNGRFDACRLLDEDLSRRIHEFLLHLRKDKKHFKAEDIIEFIATPEMQEAMGTRKTSISKSTVHRWLKRMGWRYGKVDGGMYIDGHEREDVVEYRTWFLGEYSRLERRMTTIKEDGRIERPKLQEGEKIIREVTHDESTFHANDRRKQVYWHPAEAKAPVRKDEGSSIMVADFLTPEIGRLKDGEGCV